MAVAGENEIVHAVGMGKGGDDGGREKEQASQELTHEGHSSMWREGTVRFARGECQGNPEAEVSGAGIVMELMHSRSRHFLADGDGING